MSFLDSAPSLRSPAEIRLPEFFAPAVEGGDGAVTLQNLVAGTWGPARGGATFEVRSPIDGTVIAPAAG
jgi:hypothetical protein